MAYPTVEKTNSSLDDHSPLSGKSPSFLMVDDDTRASPMAGVAAVTEGPLLPPPVAGNSPLDSPSSSNRSLLHLDFSVISAMANSTRRFVCTDATSPAGAVRQQSLYKRRSQVLSLSPNQSNQSNQSNGINRTNGINGISRYFGRCVNCSSESIQLRVTRLAVSLSN